MIEKSEQGPNNNFRQLYKNDNVGPSEIAKWVYMYIKLTILSN